MSKHCGFIISPRVYVVYDADIYLMLGYVLLCYVFFWISVVLFLRGSFFSPNSFVLEALIYVQFVLYSGIEILTRILAWLRSWRHWFLQRTKYGAKMVNAIFAYRKTGGVIITKKNGHLPSLQIYCSVLTILQHIFRGQICENPIFRPVHKHLFLIRHYCLLWGHLQSPLYPKK